MRPPAILRNILSVHRAKSRTVVIRQRFPAATPDPGSTPPVPDRIATCRTRLQIRTHDDGDASATDVRAGDWVHDGDKKANPQVRQTLNRDRRSDVVDPRW